MDRVAHFKKSKTLLFRDIDEVFINKYKTFCYSLLRTENQNYYESTYFN
ncbi:hypothetical protein [Zunongwangia profunda]